MCTGLEGTVHSVDAAKPWYRELLLGLWRILRSVLVYPHVQGLRVLGVYGGKRRGVTDTAFSQYSSHYKNSDSDTSFGYQQSFVWKVGKRILLSQFWNYACGGTWNSSVTFWPWTLTNGGGGPATMLTDCPMGLSDFMLRLWIPWC